MTAVPATAAETRRLFDLTGRVALVTGAGQGVGAGIARRLAEHGAAVAVNDLFADRADATVAGIERAGGSAATVVADVTDADAVADALHQIAEHFGSVDVLVNNAGVPPAGMRLQRFVDTAPPDWDQYLSVNLYGTMHCVHAVLPAMVTQGWGRLVTIVSDAGRFGEPMMAAYCAAKAGAAGFTRGIAREVARHGVTANAISLGSIEPPEPDPSVADRAARYPVKRLGRPDDIAAAVVWLASDDAAWVTGQTISINGGFNTAP